MTTRWIRLQDALKSHLGERILSCIYAFREITLEVHCADYYEVMQILKNEPDFSFEELIDLCGMDYIDYEGQSHRRSRYAVVVHLLSVTHNWRLRVRVFAEDDDAPVLKSIMNIWPAANWYEREAFDLFGILFEGHSDLRRILTDYGFVGHPLRKDFPTQGFVEMRYDEEKRKVIYQPVTVEQREITPRIVREDSYGKNNG